VRSRGSSRRRSLKRRGVDRSGRVRVLLWTKLSQHEPRPRRHLSRETANHSVRVERDELLIQGASQGGSCWVCRASGSQKSTTGCVSSLAVTHASSLTPRSASESTTGCVSSLVRTDRRRASVHGAQLASWRSAASHVTRATARARSSIHGGCDAWSETRVCSLKAALIGRQPGAR
jgi:hypothetical protein